MIEIVKLLGLTLPEPPSANRWWRSVHVPPKNGQPGKTVVLLSQEARDYKKSIGQIVRTKPFDGDVRLSLDWYRGRRSGDLDKRLGVVLDALQGTFYHNDSQIVELVARRFDDKNRPRIVVRVDPIGVVQQTIFQDVANA